MRGHEQQVLQIEAWNMRSIERAILVPATFLFVALFAANAFAQPGPPAVDKTAEVVAAAQRFLATLDENQRAKVLFDFKDEAQRKRWSNLPVGAFQRGGLRVGDLTQPQRDAAMAVLASALGSQGYEKVLQILESDEVLKTQGGGRGGRRGRRGGTGGSNFGRDQYFISFLGAPSAIEPWMIQFGGHHLGLNVTLAGREGTLAPSHTGAQPSIYEMEGKTVRPLGREVDKAFALLSALDEGQRQKAILGFQIRDLVLGPGRDGQTIEPEGIKGSELNENQREMLVDLASEWTGMMHDAVAAAKLEEIKRNIAETWFAWSGPTEQGAAAYFRVQGPTVHIEFAPQRMGGDAGNHLHTIYRDPTNEYGKKWWNE
jgi:hypothetical protein